CVDRTSVGLEPACIKACPTGCLQFGTKDDMVLLGKKRVAELQAAGFKQAVLYDPPGVNGTGVVTVLAHGDHPEWYELPANPKVPLGVRISKKILKPLGLVAIFGAIGAAFAHFFRFGPKVPAEGVSATEVEIPAGPRDPGPQPPGAA